MAKENLEIREHNGWDPTVADIYRGGVHMGYISWYEGIPSIIFMANPQVLSFTLADLKDLVSRADEVCSKALGFKLPTDSVTPQNV